MTAATTTEPLANLRERAKHEEPAAIIADLGTLFPCLQKAQGLEPWDSNAFHQWALQTGGVAKSAARFVLAVWSGCGASPWACGEFTLADLADMGQEERAIIAAWVRRPFWL